MNTPQRNDASTFNWLNITQFLGALNDNTFRWLVVFCLIGIEGKENAGFVSQKIAITFVVPFLIFTPLAGKLADRLSKQAIIVKAKAAEIGIMLVACLALTQEWSPLLYGVLFLMCVQSAFFGPCKYGIVPELVTREQLSRANAQLVGLTYLAVVCGVVAATLLSNLSYSQAGLVCVLLSIAGFLASLKIRRTRGQGGRSKSSLFFVKDVWTTLRGVRNDRDLLLAVFASAYFMLVGGFLQTNLVPYGIGMGFTPEQSGYLFAVAAIGIGIGSYLAGRLSGVNVEIGIVPIGALGLTVSALALAALQTASLPWIFAAIVGMGISAGLFIVPIDALIQLRSPDSTRGQVVAASGFLGWVGVLGAAILHYVLTVRIGMSPASVFAVLGILTLFMAIAAVWRLPDFLVRFMIVLMAKIIYRIKVVGAEKIPTEGPALLVANHVSRSDAVIIGSLGQRRIRFVMSREFYEASRLKWVFRLGQAILISEKDPPKQIIKALKTARSALDEGYLVCIFAEGGITRNGLLQAFRGGVERIVKGTDYPIIPLYLGGLWGSIFSYSDGKLGGRPKRIPYPVSIHIGDPLPASATRHEIRQKVLELSCDYFVALKECTKSPGEQFLRQARRHWGRPCVSDVTGRDLTYGQTATAAQLLANRLRPHTVQIQNVGIMLPPSVAGTWANLALALLGKTSVNLSYVCSPQVRDGIVEQCRLQHILTSRAFLQKLEFGADEPHYLFIEDLMADFSIGEKLRALLRVRCVPLSLLPVTRHCAPDDVATILFSSGSTGIPKGIQLSHFNISSNLEAARTVFRIGERDVLCGVLPFFHAFGLTVCLWLPLTSGAAACYLPNPLDGKALAKTIKEKQATILLATPTFLLGYLRRATREDFASLRSVVVGAEKLKTKLADAFEKRFGLRPQEGYGTTELAPLASLSIADVTVDGTLQIGTKQNSVGQPLPGVATRVVDIESHAPLGPNEPGLLLIRGPNVMLGYLNDPEKTGDVLQGGWYNTGDIASVDDAGFISITDRLSRFSKIGGEMVPHIRVEEVCAAAVEADEPVVAVTSLPHDKKGEELIVLYVKDKADPKQMQLALSQSDLPNLCKPRPDNFLAVDALPMLGSGKLDVMGLKELARSRRDGDKG